MPKKGRLFLLGSVTVIVPITGYTLLLNRRLQHRLPLNSQENLPTQLSKPPRFGVHPRANLTEGWYVDVPQAYFRSKSKPKVQEFTEIISGTWPLRLGAQFISFLDLIGFNPFESRKVSDVSQFQKGESSKKGTFVVEKGTEESNASEISFSYWLKPHFRYFLGGFFTISCKPLDENKCRVWFISNVALNLPFDVIPIQVAEPGVFGSDALINVTPNIPQSINLGLWMLRLSCRVVFDAALIAFQAQRKNTKM